MIPLKALYDKHHSTLTRSSTITEEVDDGVIAQLMTREYILIQLQQKMLNATQLMKNQAENKRKHVTLEIRDLALVKL